MAEQRQAPKIGDVVWVRTHGGVMGIYQRYDVHGKMLVLSWPNRILCGIWPRHDQGFSPVRAEDIEILSPVQILEKMELLIKQRDDKIKSKLTADATRALAASAIDIY